MRPKHLHDIPALLLVQHFLVMEAGDVQGIFIFLLLLLQQPQHP